MRLTTERLLLRPLSPGDEADVLAYRGRPDVSRYLESEPMAPEEVKPFIAERMNATRIEKQGDRILLGVEVDGHVIGDVRLRAGRLEDQQGELGWVFHPGHQGKGYATEAARALVRLGFGELGLHRIWAQLDPRNEASARVCRRLGMRQEAHLVEESRFKGEWGDLAIYALLDREWQAGVDDGRWR
ncbi:GNAT family N-acetyltransferase [Paractinoplanes atraurantiacus]|uniref:Aminoglycoside 6'-N-acetyltransferase n=1 Tax=Paractinoplanes atraurantiacus TaxID=1036182 RepID=A0A285K047_9ACTN|nr:GNAT family N-acetyltransferase [Actinoplanes atraurantiacus]SNY65888.1 aminoglycoside 6'-N-acetyltransferase [Actinoplanes atraurantiacus]